MRVGLEKEDYILCPCCGNNSNKKFFSLKTRSK